MIILDAFSDFSSVESEFCIEVLYKAGPGFNFLCDSYIKSKTQPFSFIKKSSSFQFWI